VQRAVARLEQHVVEALAEPDVLHAAARRVGQQVARIRAVRGDVLLELVREVFRGDGAAAGRAG